MKVKMPSTINEVKLILLLSLFYFHCNTSTMCPPTINKARTDSLMMRVDTYSQNLDDLIVFPEKDFYMPAVRKLPVVFLDLNDWNDHSKVDKLCRVKYRGAPYQPYDPPELAGATEFLTEKGKKPFILFKIERVTVDTAYVSNFVLAEGDMNSQYAATVEDDEGAVDLIVVNKTHDLDSYHYPCISSFNDKAIKRKIDSVNRELEKQSNTMRKLLEIYFSNLTEVPDCNGLALYPANLLDFTFEISTVISGAEVEQLKNKTIELVKYIKRFHDIILLIKNAELNFEVTEVDIIDFLLGLSLSNHNDRYVIIIIGTSTSVIVLSFIGILLFIGYRRYIASRSNLATQTLQSLKVRGSPRGIARKR